MNRTQLSWTFSALPDEKCLQQRKGEIPAGWRSLGVLGLCQLCRKCDFNFVYTGEVII